MRFCEYLSLCGFIYMAPHIDKTNGMLFGILLASVSIIFAFKSKD
jgi:hypothetical protein